jgi:hypothetical protein
VTHFSHFLHLVHFDTLCSIILPLLHKFRLIYIVMGVFINVEIKMCFRSSTKLLVEFLFLYFKLSMQTWASSKLHDIR